MNDCKFYWMDDDGNPIEEVDEIHEGTLSCDDQIYNFIEAEEEINNIVTIFTNVVEVVTKCFVEIFEALQELIGKLKELFETRQKWPIVWKIEMIIIIKLKIIEIPP